MSRTRLVTAAALLIVAPAALPAQASASLQVQVTVLQPPSYVTATSAVGTGLGLRLVGNPNCTVSAAVDGQPLPLGPCAAAGLLTAAAQQALGRAARTGKPVVVTMTIDAGT